MNTWDYLERVRALEAGRAGKPCSDYRLAQVIGVKQPSMVAYRKGRQMDDGVAVRVAEVLGLPEIQVIADVRKARATAEGDQRMLHAWEKIADFARRHAPVVLVLAIFAGYMAPTHMELTPYGVEIYPANVSACAEQNHLQCVQFAADLADVDFAFAFAFLVAVMLLILGRSMVPLWRDRTAKKNRP